MPDPNAVPEKPAELKPKEGENGEEVEANKAKSAL